MPDRYPSFDYGYPWGSQILRGYGGPQQLYPGWSDTTPGIGPDSWPGPGGPIWIGPTAPPLPGQPPPQLPSTVTPAPGWGDTSATAQAWRWFGVGLGPPRRGGKRRRKRRRRATASEERRILDAIANRAWYNVHGWDDPNYQFSPGGPGIPQTRAPAGPTSILAVLGRWAFMRTILGLLWPSRIDPADLPQRSPGPPRRGGGRGGRVSSPADLPDPLPPAVIGPLPSLPRAPIPTGRSQTRTETRTTSQAQPAPAPAPSTSPLPQPRYPAPAPATVPAGRTSTSPSWRDLLPYLAPLLLRPTSLTPSRGRIQLADPIDPGRLIDPTLPLTSLQPSRLQSRECPPCEKERKRKGKRKSRTVCYSGTYTERANGLIKRKRKRVPCQSSSVKRQLVRALR